MKNYKRTKYTCYFTYVAMSSVFSLPPMLFVTFHEMYKISYTLLGTLLLVNFCTQLLIDLIFTFFSKHFNIALTVKIMPLITSAGLAIYALVPLLSPENAVYGLIGGTIVFSVAAGLCEVLLSPMVAALPSEHPDKDMSLLHSLYGWGVVSVVLVSSLYFKLFGTENWAYLAIFWAVLPLISSFLFFISPMPEMNAEDEKKGEKKRGRAKGIALCAVCIFLGSSSENIMTGWISSFMEKALLIPKSAGDIAGMAVFALLLAFTRGLYAKFGKNILKALFIGMCGAAICYLTVGFSNNVIIGFAACILTGVFVSMLWPGTLIYLEESVPAPGVAAYALMAACGDLGAAFAPQAMGAIVDKYALSEKALAVSAATGEAADALGLKFGMLCTAVFPVLGAIWIAYMFAERKKQNAA
ncbi:MAG: MFS transporter [Clostridia bacterium]|nr:MFS transporter [Clostridia bacterium]